MSDLARFVDETPRRPGATLVAVDGVDGSGKTTFADVLASEYANRGRIAVIVHLDDFLNPRAIRHRRGRASPEGFFLDTYDLGAFTSKVLEPLRPGGTSVIVPRALDLHTDSPVDDDPVVVPPSAVVVVEGMFLHRDELVAQWDRSVFLNVPFTVTASRMAERDGSNPNPDHPSLFRYVEGQRIYLGTCKPAERATCVIDNY